MPVQRGVPSAGRSAKVTATNPASRNPVHLPIREVRSSSKVQAAITTLEAPVVSIGPLAAPPTVAPFAASGPPARRFVRVFDAPADDPAVPEHHASEPSVVGRLLGAEQLTVLRARHAEILARISARGGDPARQEALREQAASVDPDGWVTESDVAAGLTGVDATLAELHRIVGRRRRRRRRRDGGSPHAPTLVTGTAGSPAAAEDAGSPDGDDEAEPDGEDDSPSEE